MTRCNSNNSRGSLIILKELGRSGKTSQTNRLVSYSKGNGLLVGSWRLLDRSTSIVQLLFAYLANAWELDDRVMHLLFSANCWKKRYHMLILLSTFPIF